jgi:hypothetical protein
MSTKLIYRPADDFYLVKPGLGVDLDADVAAYLSSLGPGTGRNEEWVTYLYYGYPDDFIWSYMDGPEDDLPSEGEMPGNTFTVAVSRAAARVILSGVPPLPINTEAPVASGDAAAGQILSCSEGTWVNDPTSFAYQWRRNGTDIAGATSSAYVLQLADNGATISCRVSATNDVGTSRATSNGVGPVTLPIPINTEAPVVTGDNFIDATLSVSDGSWDDSPDSFSYQWKRNGSNITGAHSSTYELRSADLGKQITCTVTATNAFGSASADSANTIYDVTYSTDGTISGGVVTESHLLSPLRIDVSQFYVRLGDVEGHWNNSSLGLLVSAGDDTYDRIDVVYAASPTPWTDTNSAPNPPGYDAWQVEGVPSADPQLPGEQYGIAPYQQSGYNGTLYYTALYSYRVPAGATSSDQFTDFTDLRHIVT